jgi:hypothetical protein
MLCGFLAFSCFRCFLAAKVKMMLERDVVSNTDHWHCFLLLLTYLLNEFSLHIDGETLYFVTFLKITVTGKRQPTFFTAADFI